MKEIITVISFWRQRWIFTMHRKFVHEGGYPPYPAIFLVDSGCLLSSPNLCMTVGNHHTHLFFWVDSGYLPSSPNLPVMVDIYCPVQICLWWWIFTVQSKFAHEGGYLRSRPNLCVMVDIYHPIQILCMTVDIYHPVQICMWWWIFTVQSKFACGGGYLPSSPNLHVTVDIYCPVQIAHDGGHLPSSQNLCVMVDAHCIFSVDSGYFLSSPNLHLMVGTHHTCPNF